MKLGLGNMAGGYTFENKLTYEDREEIIKLKKEGWTNAKLARKYKVDRTVIIYHIKRAKLKAKEVIKMLTCPVCKKKFPRLVSKIRIGSNYCSQKCFRKDSNRKYNEGKYISLEELKSKKDYRIYLKEEQKRLGQIECKHEKWNIRCAVCQKILGSDATHILKTK